MFIQLLVLGFVIGANNFATALAFGALGQEGRKRRILSVFAAFEFAIPLLGLWIGQMASESMAAQADWLGPALLAGLGAWTLFQASRRSRKQEALARWLASWRGLLLLSAGLSLDNLVIGFSLGLGGVSPLLMASVFMTSSVIFAWIGLKIGAKGRRSYQSPTEVLAALLLIGMAWAEWSDLL